MSSAFATFKNLYVAEEQPGEGAEEDARVRGAPIIEFHKGRELEWVKVDVRGFPAFRKRVQADRVWVRAGDTDMSVQYTGELSGMTPGKYVTWVTGDRNETPEAFGARAKKVFATSCPQRPPGVMRPGVAFSGRSYWRFNEYFAGSAHLTKACYDAGAANATSYDKFVPQKYTRPGMTSVFGRDFDEMFAIDYGHSVVFKMTTAQRLQSFAYAHVVHFSPVCTTFSNLAASVHQRSHANNFLGVTPEAHAANGTLLRIYHLLKARFDAGYPVIFTIENPDAAMSYHPVIKAICRELGAAIVTLTFCAFGETVRKPTVFVTNSQTLIGLSEGDTILDNPEFFEEPLEYVYQELKSATVDGNQGVPITVQSIYHCDNTHGCCAFRRGRHDSITVRNVIKKRRRGQLADRRCRDHRCRDHRCRDAPRTVLENAGKETSEVTAFPPALCTFLAACLRTDALALRADRRGQPLGREERCETTACVFAKHHTGLCSHEVGQTLRGATTARN